MQWPLVNFQCLMSALLKKHLSVSHAGFKHTLDAAKISKSQTFGYPNKRSQLLLTDELLIREQKRRKKGGNVWGDARKKDWSKNESSTCWRDYTFELQTNPPAEILLSKLVSQSAWLSAAVSGQKGVTALKDRCTIMSVEEQSYDDTIMGLSVWLLFLLRTVWQSTTDVGYKHLNSRVVQFK